MWPGFHFYTIGTFIKKAPRYPSPFLTMELYDLVIFV